MNYIWGDVSLKILHVINNLGSGGAEKLIEESLPIMNEIDGIQADVLLLTDENNKFDKNLKAKGIKVDVVKLRSIYNPLNIFEIKKYIINNQYDIIHAHLFPSQYWVGIVSKIMRKNKPKFVTTEHSTHNRRRDKPYFRYIDRFIYSSYDLIVSISQKAQENLIGWLEPKINDMRKFKVIENGINIDKYKNAIPYKKEELNSNFTEDTKLVCMVGRFSEQKDQATLIQAMKCLPKEVHLLLVGEGPLRKQSENLVEAIGLKKRVHFLGFRDDVDRILKTSDIIVLSSHWEGLSLVSIEGMAVGKPFVASKVQGLKEIVDGYGVTFKQGNSSELSKIIQSLINNNEYYKEICKKCSEKAKMYDINIMVNAVISTYYNLLGHY